MQVSPIPVLSSGHYSQEWGSVPARDTLSDKGHRLSLPSSFYIIHQQDSPTGPIHKGSITALLAGQCVYCAGGQTVEAGVIGIPWPKCLDVSIVTKPNLQFKEKIIFIKTEACFISILLREWEGWKTQNEGRGLFIHTWHQDQLQGTIPISIPPPQLLCGAQAQLRIDGTRIKTLLAQ